QPGIGGSGLLVAPPLGADHRRFLLRLADEQYPFRRGEFLVIRSRHVILALALLERHDGYFLLFGELLHLRDERLGDRIHQRAGCKLVAAVKTEKAGDSPCPLQCWHVHVQVHAVDSFDLQGDVLSQHFGNASWYAHFGSGTTPILRDRLPLRRPKSLARTACSSSLSTGAISRIMPDVQA